jgi:hypothetical protein
MLQESALGRQKLARSAISFDKLFEANQTI